MYPQILLLHELAVSGYTETYYRYVCLQMTASCWIQVSVSYASILLLLAILDFINLYLIT